MTLSKDSSPGDEAAASRRPTLAQWAKRLRSRAFEPLLRAMDRVAERADLATRCEPLSRSELAPLRSAFDAMMDHLERRELGREQIRRGLQSALWAREQELREQNVRMRELLERLDQGLITVDHQGRPNGQRSRAFDRWFGAPEPGQTFAQIMARASSEFAGRFATQWAQLSEGILPVPLVLAQLPSTLTSEEGRHFRLSYREIDAGETPANSILIAVSELTDIVEQHQRDHEQRQLLALLERVSADRASFMVFFQESELLLRNLVSAPAADPDEERRELHTLKANLRLFELESLALLVDEVEERCVRSSGLSDDDRSLLAETWQRFAERALPLLGGEPGRVAVDQQALQRLLAAIQAQSSSNELQSLAARIQKEAVSPKLERMADGARARAQQLVKAPIRVELDAEGVLAAPDLHWFWLILPHVIANAVEHGLEPREERATRGKPAQGTLRLSARERGNELTVEVEDDGRGLDWGSLLRCASRMGVQAVTPEEQLAALFAPGVSTAQANDTSTRGIGLAAVEAQCRRHGARIDVKSEFGRGTRFRFTISESLREAGAPKNLSRAG